MSALVIKTWQTSTKPIDSQNNFVSITGREGGFIAWLLSLMGIDPTTTILVGLERIEFSKASLAGTESRIIPLQNVCSSYYGYYKPWKEAARIMVMFVFIGIFEANIDIPFVSFIMTFLAGAALALVYYFLNRTLTLGFVEHSGVISSIRFKRSIIENIDINQEQAKLVCIILQRLIEAKEKRNIQTAKQ